jgi:prefoldin subunit 5
MRFFPATILALLVVLTAAAPFDAAAQKTTAPDTARVDTSASKAAKPQAAKTDSGRAKTVDPAYAWTTWKDISRAIALRPLDGPDDILEKTEIIEDRIDDLLKERQRMQEAIDEWKNRHQSLEIQLEILEDLAEMQRGGDLQLQQRMHSLREDLRKAAQRRSVLKKSLHELEEELARLRELVKQYQQQAAAIRRREEENR